MKQFFHTLKDAVSSRAFYHKVLKGEKPTGFVYMITLLGIISFILTIVLSIAFFTSFPKIRQQALNEYPDGLIVTVDDGTVSINEKTPYYLFDKHVVIDTTIEPSISALGSYKSDVLITKNHVIVKDDREVRINSLEGLDITLSKEKLTFYADQISKYTWIIPMFLFVGIWIASVVATFIGALVYGCLVWLVLYLLGHKVHYKRAYAVTLYALTIPAVLSLELLATSLIVIIITLVAFKHVHTK